LAQVTLAVANWSCVCPLLMMFTEAIDCALACTSWVWSSVAPLAIALYFAYLLYTVAAPPAGPAPVEKDTKTASASPDDVSTDAGESDSEGSSQEGSDESISVRAGADDDTSSCADVCLDAVSDGMVYSRDLLLAYRVAPPPPPPGLEKPRAMYSTQAVAKSSPSTTSMKGAWGGDHWAGYHAKQLRVKSEKSVPEKTTTPTISPKTTAVRETPPWKQEAPWLARATVPQTFVA